MSHVSPPKNFARSCRFIAYFAVALLIGVQGCFSADDPTAESRLISIKSRLPFISLGDFLYHREVRDYSGEGKVTAAYRVLTELESPELGTADLVALTAHADADIRVLALLGLFAKETPDFIPSCIKLLNDKSSVLSAHSERGGRTMGDHRIFTQPMTVSDVATKMLQMVGCPVSYRNDGTNDVVPDNASWWALRKDNPDWLAWEEFLFNRASQGTMPPPYDAKERIRRFRQRIDAMPPVRRAWTLLFLADGVFMMSGNWQDYYCSEKEMIEAVQILGPEKLIEFLRSGKRSGLKEPGLDKPGRGSRFIVTYSPRLFQKQHAGALLELKLFTAAADADPSMVRRTMDAAMAHLSGDYQAWERGRAMATLAALGDSSDRDVAVKWFYSEPNADGGSTAQGIFISELERRAPDGWRDIVKRLVAHESFDRLRPIDVMELAQLVEKLGGQKVLQHVFRYEDNSDIARDSLRKLFGVRTVDIAVLQTPTTKLSGPAWSVEFDGRAHSIALSDDGKLLAVGMVDDDQGVHILNTDGGQKLAHLPARGGYFNLSFQSDATLTFAPFHHAPDWGVCTWKAGEESATRHSMTNQESVLPCGRKDQVLLWDTDSLALLDLTEGVKWKTYQRKRGFSPRLASPDGRLLALNDGWTAKIELVDMKDGSTLHALEGLSVKPMHLHFSRDSSLLIAAGDDSRVVIWKTSDGKQVARYRGDQTRFGPLAFSPDGRSFYASSGNQSFACYDIRDGTPRYAIPIRCSDVEPSADGNSLYLLRASPSSVKYSLMEPAPKLKFIVERWEIPPAFRK